MGTISNRILISSVNDGTTIHGSLRATKSLTQGWDGASCLPDWTNPGTQENPNPFYHPVIYLALYNGNTQIQPTSFTWYYNGTALTFNSSTGMSTNTGMVGWFKSSYEDPDGASGVTATQCLTLYHNLAGENNNLDIDLIKLSGTVEISGAQVPFEAGIDITLTDISSTGYLGVLTFTDGKSTLDGNSDTVTLNATLFSNGSRVDADHFKVKWSVNGGTAVEGGKAKTLSGSDVTDIATVMCYFYHNPNGTTSTSDETQLVYSAMMVVDDVGDPQYMYIRYTIDSSTSTNDGAPVSLHSGQSVTYKIWVAESTNSNSPFSLTKLEVQSHKADGTLVTSSTCATVFAHSSAVLKTAGNYDANGWCTIGSKPSGGSYSPTVKTDNGTTDANGGTFTVVYDDVSAAGANISMIVRATLA